MTKPDPDFSRERELANSGYLRICGIDEAGRGPLAGPVVAAAVILDEGTIPKGLHDSKKLSARRRAALCEEIMVHARMVGIGISSVEEIDRLNIRRATHLAMARAAEASTCYPDYALVDGNDLPSGLPCPGETLVKGDARSLSIAAASIVAKHLRDQLMQAADNIYPGYGFSRHSGYGTKKHLESLALLGPSPFHRASFSPVRELIS